MKRTNVAESTAANTFSNSHHRSTHSLRHHPLRNLPCPSPLLLHHRPLAPFPAYNGESLPTRHPISIRVRNERSGSIGRCYDNGVMTQFLLFLFFSQCLKCFSVVLVAGFIRRVFLLTLLFALHVISFPLVSYALTLQHYHNSSPTPSNTH